MMPGKDTKYADLDSTLQAVGKTVFVNFYYDFKDTSISEEELAEKLFRENPLSRSKKQGFRIPRARYIFAQNWQLDALEKIIISERVPAQVRDLAKKILERERELYLAEKEKTEEAEFIDQLNKSLVYDENRSFEYDNTPRRPKTTHTSTHSRVCRDRNVAANALWKARYLCEADSKHYVFRRKNSQINYTEPHHLVPLSAQKSFTDIDLDREQNVVSLCSNCHNRLHYGAEIDEILLPLYEKRKKLLADIGLVITYEKLKSFYK